MLLRFKTDRESLGWPVRRYIKTDELLLCRILPRSLEHRNTVKRWLKRGNHRAMLLSLSTTDHLLLTGNYS